MTPKVKDALERSIKKWEDNAAIMNREDARISAGDCPLCNLFFMDRCRGCPVSAYSGSVGCGNTPYISASKAYDNYDLESFKSASMVEVEFLKSLREQDQ